MAQSFVVRRYKEGDEKGIVELMGLCSGKVDFDYWMKHWVWEYKENPFGKIIWITEHKGQIVSHVALVRVNLKVGKKVFKSAIVADAMTHPNFRQRGLQRKIYAVQDVELVKAGIYLAYWFPSDIFHKHPDERSYAVCKIPVLIRFLGANGILRVLTRSRGLAKVLSIWLNPIIGLFFRSKEKPLIGSVKIAKIEQFDDRIDDFWKDVSVYFDITVVRNKEYLNWRYFKNPDSNFTVLLAEDDEKILGYIVFCSKDETGFIVDVLVYPLRLDVIQSLVSMAVEQLQEEKANWIFCWMSRNNPYYKVLRANSFISSPLPNYPFRVTIYSPSKVPTEFVRNPNNWYLTLADTDGITTIQHIIARGREILP